MLFDTYKSSLMDTLRCEMKRLPDGMPEVKATSLGYHGALLGAAALVLKVQQTEKEAEMDTDRIVLGVDVGGTKIRYGLMDMEGTVLTDDQCRSRAMPCREWFSFITEKLIPF